MPHLREYGDLLHASIRKTGQQVIVCMECDFLWPQIRRHRAAADLAPFPVVLRKYK